MGNDARHLARRLHLTAPIGLAGTLSAVGGAEILIVLLMFGFFGLWIAGIVFWIMSIVEIARIPDDQFRAAGSEKIAWVLIVVLAQIIGALVWRFVKRKDVLAAAGHGAAAPAGWYPEPDGGAMRWWDGYRWTEHQQPQPPPA